MYINSFFSYTFLTDSLKVSQSKRLDWYEGDKEVIFALLTRIVQSHIATMPPSSHSEAFKEPVTPDVRFMGEGMDEVLDDE